MSDKRKLSAAQARIAGLEARMAWSFTQPDGTRLSIGEMCDMVPDLRAQLAAKSAECEGLRKDAERYRFLRSDRPSLSDGKPFISISHSGAYGFSGWTDEHADSAIDAALAKEV